MSLLLWGVCLHIFQEITQMCRCSARGPLAPTATHARHKLASLLKIAEPSCSRLLFTAVGPAPFNNSAGPGLNSGPGFLWSWSAAVAMVKVFGFGPRSVQPRTAFDHFSARDEEDDYDAAYEEMTRSALQAILDDVDRALFDDGLDSRAGCDSGSAVYITEAQEWSRALPHLRARGHAVRAPAARGDSEGGGRSADGAIGTSSRTCLLSPVHGGLGGGEGQGEDEDEESVGVAPTEEEGERCGPPRSTNPLAYVPLVLGQDLGRLVIRGVACPFVVDGRPGACWSAGWNTDGGGAWSTDGGGPWNTDGGGAWNIGGGVTWNTEGGATWNTEEGGEGIEEEEEVLASHGILEETIATHRTGPPSPSPATLAAPFPAGLSASISCRGGHARDRSGTPEATAELRLADQLGLPPRSPALAIRHHVVSEIVDMCWHALMPLLSMIPELVAYELQARAGGARVGGASGGACAGVAMAGGARTGEAHASSRQAALAGEVQATRQAGAAVLRLERREGGMLNGCCDGVCCAREGHTSGPRGGGVLAPTQASTAFRPPASAACPLPFDRSPVGLPAAPSFLVAPERGPAQLSPLHASTRMSVPSVLAPSLTPASRSVTRRDETHGGSKPPIFIHDCHRQRASPSHDGFRPAASLHHDGCRPSASPTHDGCRSTVSLHQDGYIPPTLHHGGCRSPAALSLRLIGNSSAPPSGQASSLPLHSTRPQPRTAGAEPRPRCTTLLASAASLDRQAPVRVEVRTLEPTQNRSANSAQNRPAASPQNRLPTPPQNRLPTPPQNRLPDPPQNRLPTPPQNRQPIAPIPNRVSTGEAALASPVEPMGVDPQCRVRGTTGVQSRPHSHLHSHAQVHSDRKGRSPSAPDRGSRRGSPMGHAGANSHCGCSLGGSSVNGQAVPRVGVPPRGRGSGRGSPMGRGGGVAGGSALDLHCRCSEGGVSVHAYAMLGEGVSSEHGCAVQKEGGASVPGHAVQRGGVPPSGRPLPTPHTRVGSGRPPMPHLQRSTPGGGVADGALVDTSDIPRL